MPQQRVKRKYKDISMSFGANPLTNDLIAIKNASAISRSIRNIVMTLPGEKPFEPQYGSKVSKVLFQNMDMISSGIIVDEIRTSINNFEPRVELLSVESNPDFDSNSYDVTIIYDIIGADIPPQQLQSFEQSSSAGAGSGESTACISAASVSCF